MMPGDRLPFSAITDRKPLILPDGVSIAKVAHEACHMADFAMSAAGVPTGVKNTEVRGYLVERIMEQLLDGGQ